MSDPTKPGDLTGPIFVMALGLMWIVLSGICTATFTIPFPPIWPFSFGIGVFSIWLGWLVFNAGRRTWRTRRGSRPSD